MEIVARGRLAGEEELPDSEEAKQRKAISDSSGYFDVYFWFKSSMAKLVSRNVPTHVRLKRTGKRMQELVLME